MILNIGGRNEIHTNITYTSFRYFTICTWTMVDRKIVKPSILSHCIKSKKKCLIRLFCRIFWIVPIEEDEIFSPYE